MSTDPHTLAAELAAAYANRQIIASLPSARDSQFDLTAGYLVEDELVRLRAASGHVAVGRKVGFANKAVWRVLKLDTLAWAHMYDDTVRYAPANTASLSIDNMIAPKIEPEIVFKMKATLDAGVSDPAAVLEAVEWLALGFEIIDCVYDGWKYQAPDFVAAFGFHAALIVGEPHQVERGEIDTLVEQLPSFKVRLSKNGSLVQEGSGRNSLRSPALCLAELASAIARRPGAAPLSAGELVSSGTLTESVPIAAGEAWTARLDGLALPDLTLHIT